ncbi:hypothetical protein ACS0TY_029526 [Phlomoides rotata]
MNVDAAFFENTSQIGFGVIIHDEYRGFVIGQSMVSSGIFRVGIGEAMGFMEALSWVRLLGFQRVKIELNAKLVVDALNNSARADTVFDDIIQICTTEFSSFPLFYVHLVNRDANVKVHCIGRITRAFPSPHS